MAQPNGDQYRSAMTMVVHIVAVQDNRLPSATLDKALGVLPSLGAAQGIQVQIVTVSADEQVPAMIDTLRSSGASKVVVVRGYFQVPVDVSGALLPIIHVLRHDARNRYANVPIVLVSPSREHYEAQGFDGVQIIDEKFGSDHVAERIISGLH